MVTGSRSRSPGRSRTPRRFRTRTRSRSRTRRASRSSTSTRGTVTTGGGAVGRQGHRRPDARRPDGRVSASSAASRRRRAPLDAVHRHRRCCSRSIVDSPDPSASPRRDSARRSSTIAASPDQPMLFATLPCTGKVVDASTALKLTDRRDAAARRGAHGRERAGVGRRHEAVDAGVREHDRRHGDVHGRRAVASCTTPSATASSTSTTGANLIVQSIPIDGRARRPRSTSPSRARPWSRPTTRRGQHAQVLRSARDAAARSRHAARRPVRLADHARTRYFIPSLVDSGSTVDPAVPRRRRPATGC